MKQLAIFLFFCISSVCVFAQPQDEIENPLVPHENSIEIGLKGGIGFTYPTAPLSSTNSNLQPVFKLIYVGTTLDENGVGKTVLLFPRSIGINVGYRKKGENPLHSWAVKLGVSRTQQNYYFNYPEPLSNPAISQVGGWVQDIKFSSAQLSVQRCWTKYFAQLSFASTIGRIKEDDSPLTGARTDDYLDNAGNGAIITTSPISSTIFLITPEIGTYGIYKNTIPYELSIGYNYGLSKLMSQKFELYQGGQNFGTSSVNYGLNSVFVNLNIPITVSKWAKEANKPKPSKPEKPKPAEKEVVVENTPRKEVQSFKQQEAFTVENAKVTVEFWDNLTVDGDIISLYLNGELLVKNQKVITSHKSVIVTLKPGENFLVMRAQNEGRIPPNTAAISINDGKKTQTVILRAKKRKNAGIRIWYEPKK